MANESGKDFKIVNNLFKFLKAIEGIIIIKSPANIKIKLFNLVNWCKSCTD